VALLLNFRSRALVASVTVGHWVSFLGAWTFDPALDASLGTAAVLYAWAARTVSTRHPGTPWPGRKSAYFQSGIALLWVVLQGPTGAFDDTFFWAHMVEHIVLVMVCAPLLLLGAPVLLILRVSSARLRRSWVLPLLRSRLAYALASPTTTWLVLALVIVATHFTPFYELTLEHPNLHRFVEHPLYLGAALLYFYPLLPGNLATRTMPPAARMVSLSLMMVPETMTGFFIYASPYVMYPFYAHVYRPFGPGALADQQLGGALMWAGSMAIDAGWIALAAHEWLLSEARKGRRLDAVYARELRARPYA
jgi:cytochrome c oxidase assembly factor CtaG